MFACECDNAKVKYRCCAWMYCICLVYWHEQ